MCVPLPSLARPTAPRCSWRVRRVRQSGAAMSSSTSATSPIGTPSARRPRVASKKDSQVAAEHYHDLMVGVQQLAVAGEMQRARAAVNEVVTTYPDEPLPHFLQGTFCLQLGELEAAVRSFQCVLEREPSHWRAAVNLASALVQLGRWVEAVEPARKAVRLQPSLVAAGVVLAHAQRGSGELTGAMEAARNALAVHRKGDPQPVDGAIESPLVVLGEILVDLAERRESHEGKRQLEEAWALAIEAADAASHAGAPMASACTLAGRVQQTAGQYESALASYEKAAKLDPSRPRPMQLRTAMITRALRACLPAQPHDVFIATYPKRCAPPRRAVRHARRCMGEGSEEARELSSAACSASLARAARPSAARPSTARRMRVRAVPRLVEVWAHLLCACAVPHYVAGMLHWGRVRRRCVTAARLGCSRSSACSVESLPRSISR